jgi:glycogen(starch) synthase
MRVALVSREVYPLAGGGIAQYVSATARLLARVADVTVLSTDRDEPAYRELRAAGDERLPGERVRFAFAPEPSEVQAVGFYHVAHCYGARVLERLRELYPDGGPDLIEFCDYIGEGFVTLQAAATLDPFLRRTRIAVRLHTSGELCEVLNGYLPPELGAAAVHELERGCLARADRVLYAGGDILGAYERFYGPGSLAPAVRVRHPFAGATADPADDAGFDAGERPLALLYAGRLERRKGVAELIAAATASERHDFRLTLIGADTSTGPLGTSVRGALELAIAEDPRIELREPLERGQLADAVRAHDAVVVPSHWECWPYAALEALHLNRPLLATPVGGLVELVRAGRSGWLADGTGAPALGRALERLLGSRAALGELVRAGAPAAHARALCDEQEILDAYQRLARAPLARPVAPAPRTSGAAQPPLVSAIVPYYRACAHVADTVESLLAQTYPRLEIVLVNDGSFAEEDWILAELAARAPVLVVSQMNRGLGAARNFGISQARGRYVFPLDADNVAEPEFVARCVAVLEARPELAYVTSWSRYIDESGTPRERGALGYQPLGNRAALVARENVAGDAAAVLPRALFDLGLRYSEELTSFEDWQLYRELHRAGRYGEVIPERLVRYRVREDSMQAEIALPRRERLLAEMRARIIEGEVRWTSSSV